MDEWVKLRRQLPADDIRLSLAVPLDQIPEREQPVLGEMLAAVEAYRRMGEVVDHCRFTDFEVAQALGKLIESGVVVPAASVGPSRSSSENPAARSTNSTKKLRLLAGRSTCRSSPHRARRRSMTLMCSARYSGSSSASKAEAR